MLIDRKKLREFFENELKETLLIRYEFEPDEICAWYFESVGISNTLDNRINFLSELIRIFDDFSSVYFASVIEQDSGLRYRVLGINLNPVYKELWDAQMNKIYYHE